MVVDQENKAGIRIGQKVVNGKEGVNKIWRVIVVKVRQPQKKWRVDSEKNLG